MAKKKTTPSRDFMEWLLAKIDASGDDIEVAFPESDPDAECLDVWKDGKFYSLSVSHTHPG